MAETLWLVIGLCILQCVSGRGHTKCTGWSETRVKQKALWKCVHFAEIYARQEIFQAFVFLSERLWFIKKIKNRLLWKWSKCLEISRGNERKPVLFLRAITFTQEQWQQHWKLCDSQVISRYNVGEKITICQIVYSSAILQFKLEIMPLTFLKYIPSVISVENNHLERKPKSYQASLELRTRLIMHTCMFFILIINVRST